MVGISVVTKVMKTDTRGYVPQDEHGAMWIWP